MSRREEAESDKLARDTQLMEMELRKMRSEMDRRRAVNPEGFAKEGQIWDSYRKRVHGSRGRARRGTRGRRRTVSSDSRRRRRRRSGARVAPRPSRPVQPRKFDGSVVRDVPLPTEMYSHHFSTVFDKNKSDPSELPDSSLASTSPSPAPSKKPRVNRYRPVLDGRVPVDRPRRRGRRRQRGRRRGRGRVVPRRIQSSGGMSPLARERFRDNLLDTYEMSELVPPRYALDSLEGVIRKRKVDRAQQGPSSLLLEVFDEWRRVQIAGSETVDELRQSISAAKKASFAEFENRGRKLSSVPPEIEVGSSTGSFDSDSDGGPQSADSKVDELEFAEMSPSGVGSSSVSGGISTSTGTGAGTTSVSGGIGTDDSDAAPQVTAVGTGTDSAGVGTDSGSASRGSLLDGSYNEDAAHQGFLEALMEWRKEEGLVQDALQKSRDAAGSTSSSQDEPTMTSTSVDVKPEDPWAGEFDEDKQHRLFTEAVMEWRRDQAVAKQSSGAGQEKLDLFSGEFSLDTGPRASPSNPSEVVEMGDDGESVGGMQIFLENVKNCVVTSYFDQMEKKLELRLESQRI